MILVIDDRDGHVFEFDETDFEEQLFAELGQEIKVEHGFLVLKLACREA